MRGMTIADSAYSLKICGKGNPFRPRAMTRSFFWADKGRTAKRYADLRRKPECEHEHVLKFCSRFYANVPPLRKDQLIIKSSWPERAKPWPMGEGAYQSFASRHVRELISMFKS